MSAGAVGSQNRPLEAGEQPASFRDSCLDPSGQMSAGSQNRSLEVNALAGETAGVRSSCLDSTGRISAGSQNRPLEGNPTAGETAGLRNISSEKMSVGSQHSPLGSGSHSGSLDKGGTRFRGFGPDDSIEEDPFGEAAAAVEEMDGEEVQFY